MRSTTAQLAGGAGSIRRVGITSYVIFRDGLDLFHYIECDDYDRAIAETGCQPAESALEAEMAPMTTWPTTSAAKQRPHVAYLRLLDTRESRERVKLGRTALTVTRLGLGTAPLGGLFDTVTESEFLSVAERAWEVGIRFFDTAPLYGHGLAEMRLGKVLKPKPRDEFTLGSKVGRLLRADVPPEPGQHFRGVPPVNPMFDFTYDGVMRSLEESLARLGLDRIDHPAHSRPRQSLRQGACGRLSRSGPIAYRRRHLGCGCRHEPGRDAHAIRARGRFRLLPAGGPLHAAGPGCAERAAA